MTDCNSPLRQPSLYEQQCCCPSNIGKNYKLKKGKTIEIVVCPLNISESCQNEGIYMFSFSMHSIYYTDCDTDFCYTDCKKWYANGYTTGGVYTINPDEETPFEVSVSIII